MTRDEIIALVNAKIAGQGSAVDVGGALPAILNGLAELAGNAVSPDSTDMTESDQMKVRKNLGLYYEKTTTGEKEVTADGNEESKLSNDTPIKEDILKVLNGNNELDFTLVDIEGGYLVQAQGITVFRIMEGDGIYTGSMWATSVYKLIYNGETTVVSKIPAKYLPIEWNQLVTEGAKIATIKIGEETTDVFVPEGGGALETVALLQIPTTEQYNVDITEYMSLNDFQKAVNLESIVAVYNSNQSFLIIIEKELDFFENVSCKLYFIDKNGDVPFWFFYDGIGTYSVNVNDVSPVAEISQLPTASMTTQELAEIGFNSSVLNKVLTGKKIGFKYQGSGYFPVISADYINTTGIIEFWSSTNKYVISFDATMLAASCTVTPR